MKIVILDGYTLNPGDLSWQGFQAIGEVQVYDHSDEQNFLERAEEAEVLVVNKFVLDDARLAALPSLRVILVAATGYNNIDVLAAAQRQVAVYNVKGYSTRSVAQHVFALLLACVHKPEKHDQWVKGGGWYECPDFSHALSSINELDGKVFGLLGFGQIGQAVARIALAFGMKVLAAVKNPQQPTVSGVTFVTLEEIWAQADVVSLHVPLTPQTFQIVNRENLFKMKREAILINTGRGGLINEEDLFYALEQRIIHKAALDVITIEPPRTRTPLIHSHHVLITPHMAWTSKEARQRLMEACVQNLIAFLAGNNQNRVA